MIEILTDHPLGFTGYRPISADFLAVMLLRRTRGRTLALKLGSRHVARIRNPLCKQGAQP